MGEAKQKLLVQFYDDTGRGDVLTTEALVVSIDTSSGQRESKLRQVHRAIERLNVVPNPIDYNGFLKSIPDLREQKELDTPVGNVARVGRPFRSFNVGKFGWAVWFVCGRTRAESGIRCGGVAIDREAH